MHLRAALGIVALGAALAGPPPAAAQVVPGELIVRFKPGTEPAQRSAARVDAGVRAIEALPIDQAQVVVVPAGASVSAVQRALEADPDVLYAEPNVVRHASVVPNDPFFGLQYGLLNTGQTIQGTAGIADADIDGSEGYDVASGSPAVPVAVIDTGVALTHPDLVSNIWVNPGEAGPLATNGRDDDANTFVDDVNGWDFVTEDRLPEDQNGHGSHVSGTIAARDDNAIGVAGVAPRASIMALRALGSNGGGSLSDIIAAYVYAARAGARVVNLSLGGLRPSETERAALAAAGNTLFVTAAGNGGIDGVGDDVAILPEFPCSYDLPNVVCVAATDHRDVLASFSNFGVASVDLGAPGAEILSTVPMSYPTTFTQRGFDFFDGTSMSAPHVAGAAALLAGRDPAIPVAELRRALLESVDPLPTLAGRTVTGGRLNVQRALEAAAPVAVAAPEPAPAPPPAPTPAVVAAPPPDRQAPVLRVDTRRRQSLRRGVLRVKLSCSEPCVVDARLLVSSRVGRRLGLPAAGTLASVHRRLASSATVVLRLSASARRRLARARSLAATLHVRAVDDLGNARTVELRVRLV